MCFTGKAKRLKQAKEEAQDEVEKYRQERERQFKEFEAKVSFFNNNIKSWYIQIAYSMWAWRN